MTRPYIIAIEGQDGTGKTTLASTLHDMLIDRTPFDSVALYNYKDHPQLAQAVASNHARDWSQLHIDMAASILACGHDAVILDRSWLSMLVYQEDTLREMTVKPASLIDMLSPIDMLVWVNAPAALCQQRIEARGEPFHLDAHKQIGARYKRWLITAKRLGWVKWLDVHVQTSSNPLHAALSIIKLIKIDLGKRS